jgi:hypothetical protein
MKLYSMHDTVKSCCFSLPLYEMHRANWMQTLVQGCVNFLRSGDLTLSDDVCV